jgi:hypothetical protein
MTRCPIRTRGLTAGPAEAHETTTPVVGLSPQVRWICSGVPAAPRALRARAAAAAGPAVAASRPVLPAPASTWRRDMDDRDGRDPSGFPGITKT